MAAGLLCHDGFDHLGRLRRLYSLQAIIQSFGPNLQLGLFDDTCVITGNLMKIEFSRH